MRKPLLLLSAAAFSLSVSAAAAPQAAGKDRHRVRHTVLAADASKGRIAIFDPAGEILWEAKTRAIHDLQALANGNILFQSSWTRLVEVTRKNETAWTSDAATRNGNEGKRVQVHAFQRLAGGVTMIAESVRTRTCSRTTGCTPARPTSPSPVGSWI